MGTELGLDALLARIHPVYPVKSLYSPAIAALTALFTSLSSPWEHTRDEVNCQR